MSLFACYMCWCASALFWHVFMSCYACFCIYFGSFISELHCKVLMSPTSAIVCWMSYTGYPGFPPSPKSVSQLITFNWGQCSRIKHGPFSSCQELLSFAFGSLRYLPHLARTIIWPNDFIQYGLTGMETSHSLKKGYFHWMPSYAEIAFVCTNRNMV